MIKIKLSFLSALLNCLVSVAWSVEVSDSLKFSYTTGATTTYTFNYPSKNVAGRT